MRVTWLTTACQLSPRLTHTSVKWYSPHTSWPFTSALMVLRPVITAASAVNAHRHLTGFLLREGDGTRLDRLDLALLVEDRPVGEGADVVVRQVPLQERGVALDVRLHPLLVQLLYLLRQNGDRAHALHE